MRSVRDGDWKLLIFRDGSKPELFNVIDDPREPTNLAEKHPKRVERLSTAVIEWDRSIGKTRLETRNENPQTR